MTPDVAPFPFPTREQAVIRDLLERRAAEHPGQPFAMFEDGQVWSYEETAQRVWGVAHRLAAPDLKVGFGSVVASWLPNGRAALLSWFATNALGAVYAPLNTAYRGAILQDVLELLRAQVLVAHVELVERLVGLDLNHLHTLVIVGDGACPDVEGVRVLRWEEFAELRDRQPPTLDRPIEVWDDATALLTSGTTGASKAVRRTYVQYQHLTFSTLGCIGVDDRDRFYVCAPMFHGGADSPIFGMLSLGGSIFVGENFSASGFWDQVRRSGSTVVWIHSAMSLFLEKQPARADDPDNPLRFAMMAPLIPEHKAFAKRFDVRIYMVYGMTEVPCPFCVVDPIDGEALGKGVDRGYELRVVDANDFEVPDGQPGELVLRHRFPWVLSPGYAHRPDATARVWRNGWFHTGDVFVRRPDGTFALQDRVKDSIRRRGENVSSAEVERELLAHPDVMTAAVVGVEAELEEEILAYVIVRDGVELDARALHDHAVDRLPYFAVPRYIAIVDSLPTNQTLRVRKDELRERGLPEGAWDRQDHGVSVAREKLRS